MKHNTVAETPLNEAEINGLPWPKTWNGAYLVVIGSFILWLGLLIALTEFGS
jgi:hypothetical protein